MAASLGMYGYVSHAKGLNESQIDRLQMVSQIVMFNGVGLCLISRKKKSNIVLLPFMTLLISNGMGFAHVPLVKMSQARRDQMWFIGPLGLGASAIGWLSLLIC